MRAKSIQTAESDWERKLDEPRPTPARGSEIPEEVELEFSSCPIGCGAGDRVVLRGRDLLHGLPGEYSIVACSECGLMRTNPRPTAATIGFYYPENYGPYVETRIVVDSAGKTVTNESRSLLTRLLRPKSSKIPEMAPGHLLEIGCASGNFLSRMKELGWIVRGIEFSDHAASHARAAGLDVRTGTVESTPDPEHPYDLVVGWMVLEHLHDPAAVLRRLNSWTRRDGWLVLSVPNAATWSFRLFGSSWRDLHLPHHLFHFAPQSLRALLARGGWDLQAVHYQQNFGTPIASLGYWLSQRQIMPSMANALIDFPTKGNKWAFRAARPFAIVESLLRQSSRMTVWARPVDDG